MNGFCRKAIQGRETDLKSFHQPGGEDGAGRQQRHLTKTIKNRSEQVIAGQKFFSGGEEASIHAKHKREG